MVTPDLPRLRSALDVVSFEVLEVEQILLRAMSKEPLQLQARVARVVGSMGKSWEKIMVKMLGKWMLGNSVKPRIRATHHARWRV